MEMTTATQNLATAEANLIAARAAADKERRDAAMAEVLRLRERIAVLKPVAEEASANSRVATSRRLELHFAVSDARAQIASWSSEPDALSFPSEAQLLDRKAQVERWKNRHAELLEEFAKAKENEGKLYWAAADAAQELALACWQHANYLRIVEGEPQSGLSIGDAGFLRIPGSLPDYPGVTVKPAGPRRILADGSEPQREPSIWEKLA